MEIRPALISLLLTLGGFLLGSLPFSVWLTRWATGRDTRLVGDGNPGATNALRAGGWGIGLAVLLLDISKAAVPVGLGWNDFALRGGWMLPVALAPVFGHAFSPFLKGRGGKALATILGTWIGLTWWRVPVVLLGVVILLYLLLDSAGWAALGASLTALFFILFTRPEPVWLAVMSAHVALIAWKHRDQLRTLPSWRWSKTPHPL